MLNIILFGFTSLLTDISSEMVYPILPIFLVSRLGVSPAIVGLIEGVAESISSLLKVFSGYFSDKIKSRKPFTLFGYGLSATGKFILYLSTSWGGVLTARIIDRLGKGVRTSPRDALIADSSSAGKKGASFGLHRAFDTFGAVTGVIIAYFLVTRFKGEMKPVFLFSVIPAVLGVFVLFFVKEKKSVAAVVEKKAIVLSWRGLDKRLKLFLLFSFVFTLGNSSNQFLLLRAKDAGNPLSRVILFYLFFNITYFLASYPAGRISDKIGRRKLLVLGYILYGVVYLGFALNTCVYMMWFLFGLYGLYMGLTDGVEKALLADLAPQDLRATTIGLHATFVGIGLFPASFIAGLLWKFFGAQAPFYFGSMLGIAASIGLWIILREK